MPAKPHRPYTEGVSAEDRATRLVAKAVNAVYRPPPSDPEAFAARLATRTFTNGKSDCELVAGLHAETFAATVGCARHLDFHRAGWGDAEAAQLAQVPPRA